MQSGEDNIKTETWKILVFTLSDRVFEYAIVRFPSRPSRLLLSINVETPSPVPTWHKHKHKYAFMVFITYPQLPTCTFLELCLQRAVWTFVQVSHVGFEDSIFFIYLGRLTFYPNALKLLPTHLHTLYRSTMLTLTHIQAHTHTYMRTPST